jgi:hypothetical protein
MLRTLVSRYAGIDIINSEYTGLSQVPLEVPIEIPPQVLLEVPPQVPVEVTANQCLCEQKLADLQTQINSLEPRVFQNLESLYKQKFQDLHAQINSLPNPCSCEIVPKMWNTSYKELTLSKKGVIFTLNLSPDTSYIAEIQTIVKTSDINVSYYKGVAVIMVNLDGSIQLRVPSESIYNSKFSWTWQIGPSVVEFRYESTDESPSTVSGKLNIQSTGGSVIVT